MHDGQAVPRRIGIIPARGGSKRVPRKNIRDFCGKPMMAHILAAAAASGLFDVLHVSTEDPEIMAIAADLGYPVHFPRPMALADDHTGLMPVLKSVVHTFQSMGYAFDQVVLLMACSPLIDAEDLQQAAALFAQVGGQAPVLSMAPYAVPIEWAFSRQASGAIIPVQPGMFATRSQDLEPRYYHTGNYVFFPTERVLRDGPVDQSGYVGHILPKWKGIDIDDDEDWYLAEALFRTLHAKKK
ncbi:MAG: acylneuraminate cytidylyltransferase family protein [Magnetococcales bacterium]|nr:acylneuraminate cytidylyltransferase family protein [Magnetococcales bacterium]MBF0115680.1 acylneuraminate cytidylyltransferase family protein [Magnetococcales bacterium]